jgi:hypothetical protein
MRREPFCTEKLPQPMAMIGIVTIDNFQRNLVVSRPDTLSGYEKLSWRTAHEQLVRAERVGWGSATPTLWAHGGGETNIAFGVPAENLRLSFHFPAGKAVYTKLVSQPGLTAFVMVDRSSQWFTGVRFRHGSRD